MLGIVLRPLRDAAIGYEDAPAETCHWEGYSCSSLFVYICPAVTHVDAALAAPVVSLDLRGRYIILALAMHFAMAARR